MMHRQNDATNRGRIATEIASPYDATKDGTGKTSSNLAGDQTINLV